MVKLILVKSVRKWRDLIPGICVWMVLTWFGVSQITTLAVAAAIVLVGIFARLNAVAEGIFARLNAIEAELKQID
jgi:hypothetical protein